MAALEAEALGPYVAGLMDSLGVQPKTVALISGEAQSTVSRLRTGSRTVNTRQFCQILIAVGRAHERQQTKAQTKAQTKKEPPLAGGGMNSHF